MIENNANEQNNINKRNNTLLIILIFLVLLLIGLFCYKMFIVDKKINNDNNIVNKDNNVDKDKIDDDKVKTIFDDKYIKKETSTDIQVVNFSHYLSKLPIMSVIVDKEGNVYLRNYFDIKSDDVLGTKNSYTISGYNDKPGEVPFDGYKLQCNNIRSASIYKTGNGGMTADIVLISKDNKVSIVSIKYDSEYIYDIEIKNDVINNIISSKEVLNGYRLIDVDNNEYTFVTK